MQVSLEPVSIVVKRSRQPTVPANRLILLVYIVLLPTLQVADLLMMKISE